jgi:hypothetical protein
MAREQRKDVDYFPHECNHGIALHVIETKYGNDGYAAFYRLLEQLGKAANHYLNIGNEMKFMYLVSALKVTEKDANDIIGDLVKLEFLDKYLYEKHSVLWSKDFMESITDAYRNRAGQIFQYSDVLNEIEGKINQSSARLTQEKPKLALVIPKEEKSKVNYSKVKESKGVGEKKKFSPPTQIEVYDYFFSKINETFWSEKECEFQANKFINFYDSKNWYVGKNKMTNWKSAAAGWVSRAFESKANKPVEKLDKKKSGVDAALEFGNIKMRDDEHGD